METNVVRTQPSLSSDPSQVRGPTGTSEKDKSTGTSTVMDSGGAGETEDLPDFLEEAFAGIVGMESVKRELKSFYNFVRVEKLRSEILGIPADPEMSYSFVLYGNPGTGKTMIARIIGKVLFSLGIRKKDIFIETDPKGLISEHVRETAKQTTAIIDSARGGTLFIDEAYGLYKKDGSNDFGDEAIDTLLKDMYDNRADYSVIIAGYRDKMTDMLNHSNPGFRSRFKFHIDIPDYSDDALVEIAHAVAKSKHYLIDADGDHAIRKCIARERIDDTFGNARYVTDLIEKSILNMADRLARRPSLSEEDLVWLRAEDIWLPEDDPASLEELVGRLNAMTGLEAVKESVRELIWGIATEKEEERRGLRAHVVSQSLNMAFLGGPGTGKTTVARLIGQILADLGVLKRGDIFVECKRQDLVGMYLGHTAQKTADAIRSALGGVLFIDEAYSLRTGDFGQEAIDTIVGEIDNHRDSLVVILAGYPDQMRELIKTNPGLASRVTRSLIFPDYSVNDMVEIFYGMLQQNSFAIKGELRPRVEEIIRLKATRDDFGNSRGVRNLFETIIRNQKSRLGRTLVSNLVDSDFSTIVAEDLDGLDDDIF